MLYEEEFGLGLWESVCAVCGTVWFGFVGMSFYCMWESLLFDFVGVIVGFLCGRVWCGFFGVNLICVWEIFVLRCGRACFLCV